MVRGRQVEKRYIDELMSSSKAEMLAIIGRRRVGKTFLVRQYLGEYIVFDFTGTQNVSKQNQLLKFNIKLNEYQRNNLKLAQQKDWAIAFQDLKTHLQSLRKSKTKKVVFFDELPWIASHKSGFLQEFTYWWNDWASHQNLLVIICGSAASWMINKVMNNKGGLHNRVTATINLKPFTLAECKQYIQAVNPALDNYQIVQLYMAIGGIPHYLQHIRKGESATQTIDRLCFQKDGALRNEFENLYAALFDDHERHVEVIEALATKWKGLTRQEIIDGTSHTDGGGLTKILGELEASTFITEIQPFQKKKKDTLYRLTDEYSLFYLKFIKGQRSGTKDVWLQRSADHAYTIWQGYAFENVCILHVEAIKIALGIAAVRTNVSSYLGRVPETREVVQVDMLIDRADKTINLCEMKFYSDELVITQELGTKLRSRRAKFQRLSKTRKTVYNTLVTTYGLQPNSHSMSHVDQVVTMDQLFLLEYFE